MKIALNRRFSHRVDVVLPRVLVDLKVEDAHAKVCLEHLDRLRNKTILFSGGFPMFVPSLSW
jgi:hypothetical protein